MGFALNVDRVIQIEGAPIGSTENGEYDPTVRTAIDAMADLAKNFGDLM